MNSDLSSLTNRHLFSPQPTSSLPPRPSLTTRRRTGRARSLACGPVRRLRATSTTTSWTSSGVPHQLLAFHRPRHARRRRRHARRCPFQTGDDSRLPCRPTIRPLLGLWGIPAMTAAERGFPEPHAEESAAVARDRY
ncbi:hypothetical protein BB8028_0004g10600 [Beauveria bassiana]|uniref:Uncharacterized protein n=1 Tax=Beauveria bassiana TaxID=176275 RepID=A0A2S7YD69_BEABA|nr:hypothetical protein BB8028_0004g10600 [Beauveria bassiana]